MNRRGTLPLPGVRWRGLTLQMFLRVVLPLAALLLGVVFGSLWLHQQAMRSLVGERDRRAAHTAAQALEEQLQRRATAVHTLALALEDSEPRRALDAAAFLEADFDLGLAVFAADGRLLAAHGDADRWRRMQVAAPQALASTQAEETFALLALPDDPAPILLILAPLAEGGVLAGGVHPGWLAQRVLDETFAPADQVRAYLLAPPDRLLYTNQETATSRIYPGLQAALDGENGVRYVDVEGSERVVAFSPVAPLGWALLLEEPWEQVASPWLQTTQAAPLVLVPLLLLALWALWFGARQIILPLQQLESSAAALAWGDHQAVQQPVGGIEEIQRLQRTLAHMAQKIARARQSLRSYIGAITAGQEEERRRLARELHDDTLQSLIALQQRVQLARFKLAADAQALDLLDELHALTASTIADLRRVVRALRPIYLEDLGLSAALEMLAGEQTRPDLTVTFYQRGEAKRLPPEVELALYRIAQEALNNAVQHANASQVQIGLQFAVDEVRLTVQDDGRGFAMPESPAEFAAEGHFGLLGMHERAELIGARLDIRSGPQGTRLQLRLPLTAPPATPSLTT